MQLGELEAYIRWMRVSTAISHNLKAEEGEERRRENFPRYALEQQQRFKVMAFHLRSFRTAPVSMACDGILKFVRDYAQP